MIEMAARRNREHVARGTAVLRAVALENADFGDERFDKAFAFNVAPFWSQPNEALGIVRQHLVRALPTRAAPGRRPARRVVRRDAHTPARTSAYILRDMRIVKVRRVGNSNVVSIPREFEANGYTPGSSVLVEELPGGELRIMPTDKLREHIRQAGRRVVSEHPEALRILAEHDPDE